MSQVKNVGVFIGRMQPPHKAHIDTIKRALHDNDHVIVILGSSNQFPTIKNPFMFEQRVEMILACLSDKSRVSFAPVSDYASDVVWAAEVQNMVAKCLDHWSITSSNVTLYGHIKDESSYYLAMFPNWKLHEMGCLGDVNATDIRNQLFSQRTIFSDAVYAGTKEWLEKWMKKDKKSLDYFIREYDFVKQYKKSWESAPYPPTFVTVDACVVCSGHVLLVKRKAEPCAGAWALPGGFINQHERLVDACIRELREETKIKVPAPVLKGSIKSSQVFDSPDRSLRGRTITHAFYIELPNGELPKVKGASDSANSKWVQVSEVVNMRAELFEDHFQIICALIGIS